MIPYNRISTFTYDLKYLLVTYIHVLLKSNIRRHSKFSNIYFNFKLRATKDNVGFTTKIMLAKYSQPPKGFKNIFIGESLFLRKTQIFLNIVCTALNLNNFCKSGIFVFYFPSNV